MTDDPSKSATPSTAEELASAEEAAAREAFEITAADAGGTAKKQAPVTKTRVTKPRATTAGARSVASAGEGAAAPVDAARPTGSLSIVQGGLGEVTAKTVDVRQGGIGRLTAEEVFVTQGGIGAAKAERIGVELGILGAAMARDARVTQGIARLIAAREATIEQSLVSTVVAGRVHADRPTGVLVMIAGRVSGDIRPVFDWRGALVFGVVVGLVAAVLKRTRPGG
jgi:hypothetical protein